jgi:hypothetical protein
MSNNLQDKTHIVIDENGGDLTNSIMSENIYQYVLINNVIQIDNEFNRWDVYVENNVNINIENTYYIFIIDTKFHDGFAHWVLECACYLPLFLILKHKYPNFKIYIKEFKNYKKLFCDYFTIYQHDIINCLPLRNLCVFPVPVSSLNIKNLNPNWTAQIDVFIAQLMRSNIHNEKKLSSIFLPRQKAENYVYNDRSYDTSDICNNFKNNTELVLNTDIILNLNTQIELVSSSKNVILIDGSAFLINGLFCVNSNIVVLDEVSLSQSRDYIKIKYIHDKISSNNHVSFIKNNNQNTFYYSDIKPFLI